MTYFAGEYDVAVIGAGHAGIEAALAAARLGCHTAVFTINMDAVGNCPCNPSIGGTAKGHLVRELDALGGEMGKTADACFLQSRMLNRGKGPAVHSLRAQIDRRKYSEIMKHKLELQENLELRQAEITDIQPRDGGYLITTQMLAQYLCRAVVVATGTYLGGRIYVGEVSYESGPDGMFPATKLAVALKNLGLPLRRFKTGTPARMLRRSIDFSELEVQKGDEPPQPFSYETERLGDNKVECHISWTNDRTKQVILENIHRSPLYAGRIEGVGPRYCPSFEDKVMRFADKPRHQLFIEPCGDEQLLARGGAAAILPHHQGLGTLRDDAPCLRDRIRLCGPDRHGSNLGVQGLSASLKVMGREPFVLTRANSYIGTLVDDLVTKGANEPYRMMTSRSEYRLVLRQDNADERLTPLGYQLGLISEERYQKFCQKQKQKKEEIKRLQSTTVAPSEALNDMLVSRETSPVTTGTRLIDLLKRPQLDYKCLAPFDVTRPDLEPNLFEQVEIEIKYEGYIQKQLKQVEQMKKLEKKQLPTDFDYKQLGGLRLEAQEKLNKIKPLNIGQASRISGVSPADVSVLLIWLASQKES